MNAHVKHFLVASAALILALTTTIAFGTVGGRTPPPPFQGAQMWGSSSVTMTPSVWVTVPFSTSNDLTIGTYDTNGFVSGSTFVIPWSGWFSVGCTVEIAGTGATNKNDNVTITAGGIVGVGTVIASTSVQANDAVRIIAQGDYYFTKGQAIECDAISTLAAGTITLNSQSAAPSGKYTPRFWIRALH